MFEISGLAWGGNIFVSFSYLFSFVLYRDAVNFIRTINLYLGLCLLFDKDPHFCDVRILPYVLIWIFYLMIQKIFKIVKKKSLIENHNDFKNSV